MISGPSGTVASQDNAVVVTAPDGKILHWNKGAEKLFGYSSQEAAGKSLTDLITPDHQIDRERKRLQNPPQAELRYESQRRTKAGALIHVEVCARYIRDARGAVEFVTTEFRDITSEKVGRETQLMSARFRDLLESWPDAIVLVDAAGRIVLLNGEADRLFGYERADLLGRPIEVLLPERYREAHIGHRVAYFAQPRRRPMGAGLQLHGLRRDGSEFPVEISLSPLDTDEGSITMSAIRDITDRKKADEKFRGLLEAAPDAMVIVNGSGRIVLVNSQTERLFGYARSELIGQTVEMIVPQRFRRGHVGHRDDFFGDPKVRPMGAGLELYAQRKDGSEFPVEISLSPLHTEEGVLVSSSIRDITDRKKVERTLQEKNVELEKASQAKDRFLASMSHELRTPLNAIIGFTGTLLMRLPGPLTADQEKQLSYVQTSARHLLSLINDLLDLAKIESGKIELNFEPVACTELVEEVAAALHPLAENKGIGLDVSVPAEPVIVRSDRRALNQILLNLANNALKFTDRGSVRLELIRRSEDGAMQTVFKVVDTGVGIRREDQGMLFSAFTQIGRESRRRYEGTGLGLHLSQKLAELLGGRISFESEHGRGSTFTLILSEPSEPER
jgi:protein-histidine pros-kinase